MRYKALDTYWVTSYGRSEELINPYGRVKKSVQTCEIIYTKDMVVYTYKAVYTN